jgi:tetratricopeptide (TPR) repeat protein
MSGNYFTALHQLVDNGRSFATARCTVAADWATAMRSAWMFRVTAAVLALILFACSSYAQAPPEKGPESTQPARALTPQDVIRLADQAVGRVADQIKTGKAAEAQQLAADVQRRLQSILQADPTNVDAQIVLGELLIQTRDFDQARRLFKDVLRQEPANFRANLDLGRYYLDTHYARQATAYLSTAADSAPPDRKAETLRLLASSLAGQGSRMEAVRTAERAVSVDPTDIASLSILVQMYLDAEEVEKALERAKGLVEAARQAHQANLADRAALERLISSYQTQIKCLAGYYSQLCKRDSRGRPTEQLEPGKEAEAVSVLSQIASAQEEIAKLNWELSYHQTLQIIEPVAGYQTEESRARLESNTSHLLNLAGLYWATHQTERAVQLFQRILSLPKPSDANPAETRRNQDTAREFLQQHGFPLTAPAETGPQM